MAARGNRVQSCEPAEVRLLLDLGGIRLWFDASGPSLLPDGETVVERPAVSRSMAARGSITST